ncbi:F0F1 ATP synthase subunit B [Limimaricola pyoseonensis]|uniref:ATP synthase subunit b n=1 Tax=Limimaricola pyoseonensis TaxID=521013 RepID=A0A1G7BYH8_9RHOB|nr:F0F1 ATP synthase subunit B [Limimaricola pyoseonensis]SDE32121.1 ATP synthase F0 subcomplex B subunit [Limimaricola pyoseonensis]
MIRLLTAAALVLPAAPAMAASGPFFSLRNTDFIVLLAFLLFVGVLLYFRVPREVGKMLDKRADGIRAELDEARGLREEAQSLLASYERKQKDVQAQADRIVTNARDEAQRSAEQAKKDIAASIQRRMTAAEEQIQSAQDKAVKEVRDQAIAVAVAAAREVIIEKMTKPRADKMIDDSIETVSAKLH